MKRKFAIPVVCALVFHAALLLGFRGSRTIGDDSKSHDPAPVIPLVPFAAPVTPVESADQSEEIHPLRGDPDADNPSLPELPKTPGPNDIVIEARMTETSLKYDTNKINPSVVGVPNGVESGIPLKGSIVDVTSLDNGPMARAQPAPLYPREARSLGINGEVVVGFTVDEEGRVVAPHVISRTDRAFEEAALRAVSKWRFEPGRRDGRVVRFKMAVPMVFRLNE